MRRNQWGILALALLLLTAILWVDWPQQLLETHLALASCHRNLSDQATDEEKNRLLPQINWSALSAGEDLAFIWEDVLYVTEGSSRVVRPVSNQGPAYAPTWSADGQWLAYVGVTDPETKRGSLWLVRRDGSKARPVTGLPGTVEQGSFVWSPTANHLAVDVPGHGLWLVPTRGQPVQVDPAPGLYRLTWSPNGQFIAYNYRLGPSSAEAGDVLSLIDVHKKERYQLLQASNAGICILGWWPDGGGILFCEIPAHSASIASDGVMLYSLPITLPPGIEGQEQQPTKLVTTLCQTHWLQLTGATQLLAVAGEGRIAWANKQLALADPVTGQVELLANPPGLVALDPSINPKDGSIAFVGAPDLGFDVWGFSKQEYADWVAHRTLWLRAPNGQLKQLAHAGGQVFGPTWSKDGHQIRYYAANALWTINADNRPSRQKIVDLGPGQGRGIYGAVDYNGYFAWYQQP